jgi:hypothetical protein
MKSFIGPVVLLAALFLAACESLPFHVYGTKSWSAGGKGTFFPGVNRERPRRVRLAAVDVDCPGLKASVEREIADLSPLLFREQGFLLCEDGAEYSADIRLREREYSSGWKTKKSLALEVRFWNAGEGPDAEREGPPLAAGRILSLADESFASSGTAGRMLSLGIRKAAGALRKAEK